MRFNGTLGVSVVYDFVRRYMLQQCSVHLYYDFYCAFKNNILKITVFFALKNSITKV